jgi:hypothetical protein
MSSATKAFKEFAIGTEMEFKGLRREREKERGREGEREGKREREREVSK